MGLVLRGLPSCGGGSHGCLMALLGDEMDGRWKTDGISPRRMGRVGLQAGWVFRCHPAPRGTRIVWDGEDVMHDVTPEPTPLVTGGFQIHVWEFVLLRCWFSGSFAAGTDPSSRLPRLRNAP